MSPLEGVIGDILIVLFALGWFGFGIWLSYSTRESGCGTKIAVAVFFTKGFLAYWFFYGTYILIKTVISFIKGMKEGLVERQQTDKKDKNKK